MTSAELLAPVYFILGGRAAGEGCVITRERGRAIDVWQMDTRNGEWFLLETNYDHWKPAPCRTSSRLTLTHASSSLSSLITPQSPSEH